MRDHEQRGPGVVQVRDHDADDPDRVLREVLRVRGEDLGELTGPQAADSQRDGRETESGEARAIHDALLPLVLNERGLQVIVDTAASMVRRPVIVFDRFHRIIASSETAEGILRTSEMALGPHLRMYFNRDGARPDFVASGGQRFLVVPLASDARTLGTLCLHHDGRPAGERDVTLAGYVGHFVALELLKQRIRLDVHLRLNSDFFGSLISDAPESEQMIADRAELLGLNLTLPSAALLARITPLPAGDWYEFLSASAWRMRDKLAGMGASGVLFPTRDSEIVFVVYADPAPLLRDQILPAVRDAFQEILSKHGTGFTIDIGIGAVGTGIDGLRDSYETAVKALALIDALGMQGADLELRDFATYSLLLDVGANEQRKYVQRVLGQIITYDERHSTELVKTLECYVDMLGNVQRTADTLYLHHTTVRYRLTRIEELVGLQLDNAEHRLTLSLALRLYRLHVAETHKNDGSAEDGGSNGE